MANSTEFTNLTFYGVVLQSRESADIALDMITNIRMRFLLSGQPVSNRLFRSVDGAKYEYSYRFENGKPLYWRVVRNRSVIEQIEQLSYGKYCINYYDESGNDLKKIHFSSTHQWLKTNYYNSLYGDNLICSLVPKETDGGTVILKYTTGVVHPVTLYACNTASNEEVFSRVAELVPTPEVAALTDKGRLLFCTAQDKSIYDDVLEREEKAYAVEHSPRVFVSDDDRRTGFNFDAKAFDVSKRFSNSFDISFCEVFSAADLSSASYCVTSEPQPEQTAEVIISELQPGQSVIPEPQPEQTVIPEPKPEQTAEVIIPEPEPEQTVIPEPQPEQIVTPELQPEQPVIPVPQPEQIVTPELQTEQTADVIFPEPQSEQPVIPVPQLEQIVTPELQTEQTADVIFPEPRSEQPVIPVPQLEQTAVPEPKSEQVSPTDPGFTLPLSMDSDDYIKNIIDSLLEDAIQKISKDTPDTDPGVAADECKTIAAPVSEQAEHCGTLQQYIADNAPDSVIYSSDETYRYYGETDASGRRDGRGRTLMSSGKTAYDGMYSADKRSGFGSFYYRDGRLCYCGNWSMNKRSGFGMGFNSTDGGCYVGDWQDNKPDGTGVRFDSDGRFDSLSRSTPDGKGFSVTAIDDSTVTLRIFSPATGDFVERTIDISSLL